MLRSLLQIIGITRLVGTAKLRLEQKADAAVDQVKRLAMRIAVAAALAVAAVIFTVLALLAGLVLLFAWLEPEYGAITALAIIAGSLVATALLLVLAAALVGRKRPASARTNQDEELAEWARDKELAPMSGPAARCARTTGRRSRREFPDRIAAARSHATARQHRSARTAAERRPAYDGGGARRPVRGRLVARPHAAGCGSARFPALITALARPLAHRVRHDRAPPPERPWRAARRVAGGLVLDFRVQLRAEQHDDRRHPHPHHQADPGAERAVGRVIIGVVPEIEGEQPRIPRSTAASRAGCRR